MAPSCPALLWATLSLPVFEGSASPWDAQNQKSLSNGISHAANCHLWSRQLPRTLINVFQSIFIFFTSFFPIKSKYKGLKEIRAIENSCSFLERQAILLPSSPHFFAFLFPAAWWNHLLRGNVCFIASSPQTHWFLTKMSLGRGAVEWQIRVSKPNNRTKSVRDLRNVASLSG